ncbi:hypothetical protein BC830DRAFT_254080 [Chytriomyces sp. MP71]|nr:hypothetical protein BC830DRAFT_254080 [Chytriomyces sp. MP71]
MMTRENPTQMSNHPVYVVTGSNTGIGYSIADQLLEIHGKTGVTVVLACRNLAKASVACASLLAKHGLSPSIKVEVLECDLSLAASVLAASVELRTRLAPHGRITALVFNAGMIPIDCISIPAAVRAFVRNPANVVNATGDTIIQHRGVITRDGLHLGEAFAANFFGHFLLLRELEDLLVEDGRVIWMTSNTAEAKFFNAEDLMCLKGTHPYESAKRLIEIVAPELSKRGLKCAIANPGVSATDVVQGKVPLWAVVIFLYIVRFFGIVGVNITPFNSAKAPVYLAAESLDQRDFDGQMIVMSDTSVFGTRRIRKVPVTTDGLSVCHGDVCTIGVSPKEILKQVEALRASVKEHLSATESVTKMGVDAVHETMTRGRGQKRA